MEDGGVVVFDFLPHGFTGGWRDSRGGVVGSSGESLVPKASLGLVRAVLGPGIVLVERERK